MQIFAAVTVGQTVITAATELHTVAVAGARTSGTAEPVPTVVPGVSHRRPQTISVTGMCVCHARKLNSVTNKTGLLFDVPVNWLIAPGRIVDNSPFFLNLVKLGENTGQNLQPHIFSK